MSFSSHLFILKLYAQLGQLELSQASGSEPAQSSSIKKENANDPANFRPITLQSVPLKVFTSCLRNAIFNFLSANNYIEQEIQKGFTPGLSGTFEHTAQMAAIINKART